MIKEEEVKERKVDKVGVRHEWRTNCIETGVDESGGWLLGGGRVREEGVCRWGSGKWMNGEVKEVREFREVEG